MRTASIFKSALAIACLSYSGAALAQRKIVPSATIGGVKPGMPYATARAWILAAGYKIVPRPRDQFCGYTDPCKLPETDACAGTGNGGCSYLFQKGKVGISVQGAYGKEGKPLSQTVLYVEYYAPSKF